MTAGAEEEAAAEDLGKTSSATQIGRIHVRGDGAHPITIRVEVDHVGAARLRGSTIRIEEDRAVLEENRARHRDGVLEEMVAHMQAPRIVPEGVIDRTP